MTQKRIDFLFKYLKEKRLDVIFRALEVQGINPNKLNDDERIYIGLTRLDKDEGDSSGLKND